MTKEVTMEQHLQAIDEFNKEFPNHRNVTITMSKYGTEIKFYTYNFPFEFLYKVYYSLDKQWRISMYMDRNGQSFQYSEYFNSLKEAKKDIVEKTFNMLKKSFVGADFDILHLMYVFGASI